MAIPRLSFRMIMLDWPRPSRTSLLNSSSFKPADAEPVVKQFLRELLVIHDETVCFLSPAGMVRGVDVVDGC